MGFSKHFDRVKMSVSGTPGAGMVTLGAAKAGFRTAADAGAVAGDTVSYVIEEPDGSAWETGQGVLGTSAGTLTRTTVYASSVANLGRANFTAAAAVYFTFLKQDLAQLYASFRPGSYSTYRFIIVSTGTGNAARMAELSLIDLLGVQHSPSGYTGEGAGGQGPANLYDGDLSTEWVGVGSNPPHTFTFNYAAPFPVAQMKMVSTQNADVTQQAPTKIALLGSNDAGVTFTFLGLFNFATSTVSSQVQSPRLELVPPSPAYSRWRIVPRSGGSNVFGFSELSYIDDTNTRRTATSAVCPSSQASPNGAAAAIDNDDDTYFFSAGNDYTIPFTETFASQMRMTKVRMHTAAPTPDWAPKTADVYVSNTDTDADFVKIGVIIFDAWQNNTAQTVSIIPV